MSTAPSPTDNAPPLEIANLTRRFGSNTALDSISINVPKGCVFGLLGENGAGKTTLIKHAMGLLNAQSGSVRVFGINPVRDPEGALSRVGYLSEDRDIPRWMRIEELMRYTQGFYPKWDSAFAQELLNQFELDPRQKIRTCSLGQTAKVGLLTALAHRPDLVVLDEPSSGLDAVVRRHILHSAIRHVAEDGRTVLFSSHLLDEVERASDYIAIINQGRVLVCDTLDAIKKSHHLFKLVFAEPQHTAPKIPNTLYCEGAGNEWTFLATGNFEDLEAHAVQLGARVHRDSEPSLEEIFLARIGSKTLEHTAS